MLEGSLRFFLDISNSLSAFCFYLHSTITTGTAIRVRTTVRQRKSASRRGRSLERGTKLVSITKNMTTVNKIVVRNPILSPLPFGRQTNSKDIKAIAIPGMITVTVTVDPYLLIIILKLTSVKSPSSQVSV